MSPRTRLLVVASTAVLALASCSNDSAAPGAASTQDAETTVATDAPSSTDAPDATDAPDTTEAPAASLGSIVEVAEADGGFTVLLQAVEAAGLTDELSTGQYTLLAPTDAAFGAVGQETIDALLADPAQLTTVLRNHLLPSPQDAELIAIMSNLVTVDGASHTVVVDGDTIAIGGATVVAADIAADNGIIHAIDTVLVPPAG